MVPPPDEHQPLIDDVDSLSSSMLDTEAEVTFMHSDDVQPTRSRRDSTHSVRRPFHRKSTVVDASTGQTVKRVYSFWEDEPTRRHRSPIRQPVPAETGNPSRFQLPQILTQCLTKPVLKATFAYLVASLAVYSTTVSHFLGSSDTKHLVSTVVVYFHASQSGGSMLQSLMFVSMALSFALVVSVGLMTIPELTAVDGIVPNWAEFVVLFFCCAALGAVAFVKRKVNKNTFNTASSLCSIVIVSCVIKEGNHGRSEIPWSKIGSTFFIVFVGCVISVVVCYSIWPKRGIDKLRKSFSAETKVLSQLLADIVRTFLSSENTVNFAKSNKLMDQLQATVDDQKSSFEETTFELLASGQSTRYDLVQELVTSGRRMASSMAGLKRSVEFKRWLLEVPASTDSSELDAIYSLSSASLDLSPLITRSRPASLLSSSSSDSSEPEALVPKELFDSFVYQLGPSVKSFSHTMCQILLRIPFEEGSDIPQFRKSMELATALFEKNESKAVERVYQQDLFKKEADFESRVDQEQVAASSANFAFSLLQFGNELENYLEILSQLEELDTQPAKLSFRSLFKREKKPITTVTTEEPPSTKSSIGYSIWKMYVKFWKADYQFGLRVGLGAMAIGCFAYMDFSREWFSEWRCEWVLITFCIIMNKSLGGTSMTIKWRFLGTFLGALTAYLVWVLFYPNVILMALSGALVALPCFHIIFDWSSSNAYGRFILLTYNLTVLYSYTKSVENNDIIGGDPEGEDQPIILEIAFHRYIAVSLGVLCALVITMTLFPVSARSRLRKRLASLWLRMGLMWKDDPLQYAKDEQGDYRLQGIPAADRRACNELLGELRQLLKQAPVEIRLKGPFPIEIYKELVERTSHMLHAIENMSSIINFDTLLSENDHLVMINLQAELSELQNRIFLSFYTLSSSIRLHLPLASKPASTEHAMERLLFKLSEIRERGGKETGLEQPITNEDFVLFYTYALVTNSLADELEKIVDLIVELNGTVSRKTLFEGEDN